MTANGLPLGLPLSPHESMGKCHRLRPLHVVPEHMQPVLVILGPGESQLGLSLLLARAPGALVAARRSGWGLPTGADTAGCAEEIGRPTRRGHLGVLLRWRRSHCSGLCGKPRRPGGSAHRRSPPGSSGLPSIGVPCSSQHAEGGFGSANGRGGAHTWRAQEAPARPPISEP